MTILVDSNVLLDLFTDDATWRPWSERALRDALARIFHQAAHSFSESSLFSFNFTKRLERCGGYRVRWPRSRLSFAPVRVHARSTIGPAMLLFMRGVPPRAPRLRALASTRTGAKSGAIFAALGEICGLAQPDRNYFPSVKLIAPSPTGEEEN